MSRHENEHRHINAADETRPATGGAGPTESPTDLPKRSWWGVLKRTTKQFKADSLSDAAAALTYYGLLAIFPALLALVSILGLVGSSATKPLLDHLRDLGPGSVRQILTTVVQQLQNAQGKAGIALAIGIILALWSASGYIAAFMRAANNVYGIDEGRPLWKTLPTRLALTIVLVALLALTATGVVFTGTLATKTGKILGVSENAVQVWGIAKWPILVIIVIAMVTLLYWAAPNAKRPKLRWILPGSLVAVALWIIASGAFALYVANFSSLNSTYGSIGAVILFLLWFWVSNVAILLGLEFNFELERGRAIEAGHPPEEEPHPEPRDTHKPPPDTPQDHDSPSH
ncbi:YihY/virulence factor BrkB family protein [Kitasatospora aureofaciens]|uniref:YihY/virulence factor BrkB family protein n=1 Tax=Kitasatospora aureofaciens TaxID=1894 RepID=UPI00210CDC19|nr:YihY/virulence factor BrkB family protein [Kitasatospora aureofaciens]